MIIEKNDSWIVLDQRFPFGPDKQAALIRAEMFLAQVKEKREKLSGRKLDTIHELSKPPEKLDTRKPEERSRARMALQIVPVKSDDTPPPANPYLRDVAKFVGKTDTRSVREQINDKLAAEWDAKNNAQEARQAFENNPSRVKIVKAALAQLEIVAWGAEYTAADLQLAEFRVEQARKGCLDHATTLLNEFATEQQAKVAARTAEAKRRYEEFVPQGIEQAAPNSSPSPQLKPCYYPAARIEEAERENPAEADRMKAETAAWWDARRERQPQ